MGVQVHPGERHHEREPDREPLPFPAPGTRLEECEHQGDGRRGPGRGMARRERIADDVDQRSRRPSSVEPRLHRRQHDLRNHPRQDERSGSSPPSAPEQEQGRDGPQRDRDHAASHDVEEAEEPGQGRRPEVVHPSIHAEVKASDPWDGRPRRDGRGMAPDRDEHEDQRCEQGERVPERSTMVDQHREPIRGTAVRRRRRA